MKYVWTCLLLVATTIPLRSHNAPGPAAEGVQVIEVTAKKYEFSPSPIRVKQGTKVQLKITATDHAHGFRITPYGSAEDKQNPGLVFSAFPGCVKIEQGHTEVVEFVAQTPGTYSFSCCVHCGWRHRSMKGELIVEP
jgi:cytochrome c oxidase subunit II